jgi:hypothetical protein
MLRVLWGLLAVLAAGSGWAEEMQIPAATAYVVPNPEGARISERGVSRWSDPKQSIVWYGEFKTPGTVSASIKLREASQAARTLRLSIDDQEKTVEAKVSEGTVIHFGEFRIETAGYHAFKLSSVAEAEGPIASPSELTLTGDPVQGAHFNLDPRRNAASVHLNYPVPKEVGDIEWFYNEVTAVDDPVTTFYMACGFHRGYFGMQVNSPTERRIIFSVWDAGNGASADKRDEVAQDNRVSLVAKGEEVHTSDFGNEGTGGHSHLKYLWKTGEPQKFLLTAQPVDGKQTVYSGYYFHPDKQAWMLISSMKAPKDGGYIRRPHSFSENFWGSTGHIRRKAHYGPQWIKTADQHWTELTKATFSHDATGKKDRLDRFMGVEDGKFFLSHGGFVRGFVEFGTPFDRAATGTEPAIELPPVP